MVLEKKNFPAENFRKVFQKPLQDKTTEIPPFLTQTRQKTGKRFTIKFLCLLTDLIKKKTPAFQA